MNSIDMKLLMILPKLVRIGYDKLRELLREFPDATTRSTLLKLYDSSGNQRVFWIGFENGEPVVRMVDPNNPPYATTEVSMHVDTFIKILKNKLDFRTAYLYDLIDIKSNDGLPVSLHFLLWSAFFDRAVSVLTK